MKILVDADACPVKDKIVALAQTYEIEIVMVCDTSHILEYEEEFVKVVVVDKGADSADIVIVNRAEQKDIAVTSDYGLAALLLGKKVIVLHPNGFRYQEETIDQLLFQRHLSKELRRKRRIRPPAIAKRTREDNLSFYQILEKIIQEEINV